MDLDFNNAQPQFSGELIPENTIVPVMVTVRSSDDGQRDCLKRSRDGTALMLNLEFTVIDGAYARHKFWANLIVDGKSDGQKRAAAVTGTRVRAMLESARGVKPLDMSEAARAARHISSWQDLDGLFFWAVVGVEKAIGPYRDKNVLKSIITPDQGKWSKLEQVLSSNSAPPTSASRERPRWAE